MKEYLYLYCVEERKIKVYQLSVIERRFGKDGEYIRYLDEDNCIAIISNNLLDKVSSNIMYSLEYNEDKINDYRTQAIFKNNLRCAELEREWKILKRINKDLQGELDYEILCYL